MAPPIPQLIQSLERELKDTRQKIQFALDAMERLEKDIELLEHEARDIERTIKHHLMKDTQGI
jgi:predicted phage-related endonuclease